MSAERRRFPEDCLSGQGCWRRIALQWRVMLRAKGLGAAMVVVGVVVVGLALGAPSRVSAAALETPQLMRVGKPGGGGPQMGYLYCSTDTSGYTYSWYRDGQPIAGYSLYSPTLADAGHTITCRVSSGSVTSPLSNGLDMPVV